MAEQLLAVGSPAPVFSLSDEQGNIVNLKSLLGSFPIVLIFYPGDMTPGCTMQLCAVRDDWNEFKKNGILVFGINHAGKPSHSAFKGSHKLPFPLLIDTDKKISELYGAIRSFFKIKIIKRTVVAIDSNGLICYYHFGMPKNADILKAITKKTTSHNA
jgi:thioredoxin-dependent peroxiredoxin